VDCVDSGTREHRTGWSNKAVRFFCAHWSEPLNGLEFGLAPEGGGVRRCAIIVISVNTATVVSVPINLVYNIGRIGST